ncbi:hypothetical protein ACL02S_19055 [Nocardia sp. 004]|uniref:hypothetical protein n=1 Tax=Nocardia sp. 004 TaxID=3385978 RepID=UPI0039A3CAB6
MKLRKTGRIAIAGLAMVAALGMTACSSDDTDNESAATTSTSVKAATTTVELPPTPTVAELNADLARALDPSVPASEKLDKVQGAEVDPELPDRLAKAAAGSDVKIVVTDVVPFGDSVTAKATFIVNGQENVVDVPFVVDNGKWKIQQLWACNMLTQLGEQSPACS